MMECLHSLTNTDCFNILQAKLNNWRNEFEYNSTESNISQCCELLELNAKIQTQLFKLLGLCAIQGNFKGTELTTRKRLLPYLGEEYMTNGLTSSIVMDILNDVSKKTKNVSSKNNMDHKHHYRPRSSSKERKRCCTRKLSDPKVLECEIVPFSRSNSKDISEKLDALKDMILDMSCDKKKSCYDHKKEKKRIITRSESYPTLHNDDDEINKKEITEEFNRLGNFSGSEIEEIRNDTYLQGVVGHYNDLFSESRVNSMNILRQHLDDHENNQRILFALVMTTAKNVAEVQRSLNRPYGVKNVTSQKLEFRKPISNSVIKGLRARIIYELLNKRGNYFRFHLPPQFQFVEMEDFIDRTIELFWKFGGVKNGLQLSDAADGELFDEQKYRRSYDSDFNAPLVSHHIWPCLAQGKIVLVKGEACTRPSSQLAFSRDNNHRRKKSPSKQSSHLQ